MVTHALSLGIKRLFSSLSVANGLVLTLMCQFSAPSWADSSKDATLKGDLELKGDANSKAMAAYGGSGAPMFTNYYGVTITNNFKDPSPPQIREEQAFWGNGPSTGTGEFVTLTDDAVWVYLGDISNQLPSINAIYYIPNNDTTCSPCGASPCIGPVNDVNNNCHSFYPIAKGEMIQLSALKYGTIFLPSSSGGATFNIYTILYSGQAASESTVPVNPTSWDDWISHSYNVQVPIAPSTKPKPDDQNNYLDPNNNNKPYRGVAWAMMEISSFPTGSDPNVDLSIINGYFFNQQLKLGGIPGAPTTLYTAIDHYGMADSTPCFAGMDEACLFPYGTTEQSGSQTVLYPKFIMVKTDEKGGLDNTGYAGLFQSYVDRGLNCPTPFDLDTCGVPLHINTGQTDPNNTHNAVFNAPLYPLNSTSAPPMLRLHVKNNVDEPSGGQYVYSSASSTGTFETLCLGDIANSRTWSHQEAPVVVGHMPAGGPNAGTRVEAFGMFGPSGLGKTGPVDNTASTGPMQARVGGMGYDSYLHILASDVTQNAAGYFIDYPQGWLNGTFDGTTAGSSAAGITFRLHVTCENSKGQTISVPTSYSPTNDCYYGLIIDNITVYGTNPTNYIRTGSSSSVPPTSADKIAHFLNIIGKTQVSGYPNDTNKYDVILISGGNQIQNEPHQYGTPPWIMGGTGTPPGSASPGGPCCYQNTLAPACCDNSGNLYPHCPTSPPPCIGCLDSTFAEYPTWWHGPGTPSYLGKVGYAAPGQIGVVWNRSSDAADAVQYYMCDNPSGCYIGCGCNNCPQPNIYSKNPTSDPDLGWVQFPSSGGSNWPFLNEELLGQGVVLTGDFNFDGTLKADNDRTLDNPFASETTGAPTGMSFIKIAANGKSLPWTTQFPPAASAPNNRAPMPIGDYGGGQATLPMFGVLGPGNTSLSPTWHTTFGDTGVYVPGGTWPAANSTLAKQIPDTVYHENWTSKGALWGVPQLPTEPGEVLSPDVDNFPYVSVVPNVGNWTDDMIASGGGGKMGVMGVVTWDYSKQHPDGPERTVPRVLTALFGFDPAQGVRNWPRVIPAGDVNTPGTENADDGNHPYSGSGPSVTQRSMGEPWAKWSQSLQALIVGKASAVLQLGMILPDSWPDPAIPTTGNQGSAYAFSMFKFQSKTQTGQKLFKRWKPFFLKYQGKRVGDAYTTALMNFLADFPLYVMPYSDALKNMNPDPGLGDPRYQTIEWILGPVPEGLRAKSDFDGNGCVGGEDLTLLISNWGVNCGKISGPCPWDTTGDGLVDGADLNTLLAEWSTDDPNCP